ncbi:MAG: response regulator, partial [Legionella sp.]
RIEDTNIKKILLTGHADEHLAIKAFNEGLIHRYIKKSDPEVASLIIKSIHDLQIQYFQSMSDIVVRMLSVTSPSCLHDKKFAAFFWELCKKKGIVEFYLADHSGSFLMMNDDAKISFLIVKKQTDLRLHYDLALDNGASEEVLDQLLNGDKIPCFWESNGVTPQKNEWEKCLVPAQKYVSDEIYYYAFVQGAVLFDVLFEKILSYHNYLEELDVEEILLV